MADEWFESVAQVHGAARRRLPSSVYQAVQAGSERGRTRDDNVAAFEEIGFAPRVAAAPSSELDLTTTVLGRTLGLPVLCSPTGAQAVHPEGELAVARAAATYGTGLGLSPFATRPLAAVVEANPATYQQLYWSGSRDTIASRLEHGRRVGAAGLIMTLDWSFSHSRDWGSPRIPDELTLREMLRFAPQVLRRPRWLWRYARTGRPPQLTVPNMAAEGESPPSFFTAYGEWMQTPPPTWDDLRWLRDRWDGPLMLKGVMRVDDALEAARVGFSAISVSNHGGNNLDGTPASIRALPAIRSAVGSSLEILFDGGIRRGGDVVKALALGADAVMIGRPYLWGLGANGQAGVENVLEVLRNGVVATMRGLGRCRLQELTEHDLVLPAGFTRVLGDRAGQVRKPNGPLAVPVVTAT